MLFQETVALCCFVAVMMVSIKGFGEQEILPVEDLWVIFVQLRAV